MPTTLSQDAIPNQVFIGAASHTVRPKYEKAIAILRKKRPLSFAIVGREENQEAEDLLQLIKDTILASSFAIFDATYGNPNVSLEYGFAEAHDIQRALYLSTHAAAQKTKDPAIIADLAGKKRNHYAQEKKLQTLLSKFASGHPYTLRFEEFLRAKYKNASKGKKHRARTLALKVVHSLEGHRERRGSDIVQALLVDPSNYTQDEVSTMILRLHQAGLIQSQQGPHAKVRIA